MWLIQSSTHQLHDLDSNVQEVAKLNQSVRALPSLPKLGLMQFLIEYWIVISAKSQGMPFPAFSEWPFAFLGREFISISLSPHLSRCSLGQRRSRMPTTLFCKKEMSGISFSQPIFSYQPQYQLYSSLLHIVEKKYHRAVQDTCDPWDMCSAHHPTPPLPSPPRIAPLPLFSWSILITFWSTI